MLAADEQYQGKVTMLVSGQNAVFFRLIPFMPALRRRGYQPDALVMFSLDMGITETDKTVKAEEFFKTLNHHNKQIIDQKANRYFFVEDPQEITVENAPELTTAIALHPDDVMRGARKFRTGQRFYICRQDLESTSEGKLYRLKDCLNFAKEDATFTFKNKSYEDYKGKGDATFHWLPAGTELVNVEVRMPDNKLKFGLGESSMKHIDEGAVVQLERFGFCRLDRKTKDKLTFWFAHR